MERAAATAHPGRLPRSHPQAGGTALVLPDPAVSEYAARQLNGESTESDYQDDDAYALAWAASSASWNAWLPTTGTEHTGRSAWSTPAPHGELEVHLAADGADDVGQQPSGDQGAAVLGDGGGAAGVRAELDI